jgi:hypothetical protein
MAPTKQERSDAPKLPPLWERLQGQIDWYDRKASANQHAYKASKIAIIVCAVIIPIVAEYSPLAVGTAAGVILLLEGCSRSTNGRRTGSSTARPARACATSSITTTRSQDLTPSSRRRQGGSCGAFLHKIYLAIAS